MGNIILGSLILGYFIYTIYKLHKKKQQGSCCEDCDCPIKRKQKS